MKRYKGYMFKQSVTELVLKIAKEFGVDIRQVRWDTTVHTAGISSSYTIFFCDVADDAVLTDIDLQRYVGFAVHELLHALYTDFAVQGDSLYLKQLHNACEDAWIEHTGISKRLTGNINGLLSALIDQMVERAMAEVTDWSDPRQYPFIFAVYLRKHTSKHVPMPDALKPIIKQACDKIGDCKSSHDTFKLAQWILSQLNTLPEKKAKPKQDPKGQSKDQGEGEGQGDEGDEGQEGQGGNRVDKNPHGNAGDASRPDLGDAVEVEPTNKAPEGTAGQGSWCEKSSITKTHTREDAWLKDLPVIPARLRYEVKRLFDNSSLENFQINRKSGSVNVRALHQVGINDKVFQRRQEVEGIDSAVVICIDVSGSMFDDGKKHDTYMFGTKKLSNRIVQASLTAQALIDTLHKAQVQTCVLTFGSQTSVLKPFGQHPARCAQALRSIYSGGGTNDYFAVRYAHKLLLNRPEERKICMVITDGYGSVDRVRDQVQVGDRLGVTTIGIGIELDVSSIYKQSVNIQSAKDLGVVSFKQIKLAV